MFSHVLVEPVEHVHPGLIDLGFVCWVDVPSLAMSKPMRLTRKYLHLVFHFAFFLQICFKSVHLTGEMGEITKIFFFYK